MLPNMSKLRAASRQVASLARWPSSSTYASLPSRLNGAQSALPETAGEVAGAGANAQASAPVLQIGNWLHSPSAWDSGKTIAPVQWAKQSNAEEGFDPHQKKQGDQPSGHQPAENPRNDVPPVPPEEREKHPEVPASPDATSGQTNNSDYSSPGAHPGSQGKKNTEPDLDNASEAVKQRAAGLHQEAMQFRGMQAKQSLAEMRQYVAQTSANLHVWGSGNRLVQTTAPHRVYSIFSKPVEAVMETPLEVADKGDDGSTGPASVDDDPPGVQQDPNTIPPADDQKGTDKCRDNN